MAMDVRETLLNYPEQSQLDILSHPPKLRIHVKFHLDSGARCEAVYEMTNRISQPGFIQEWRIHQIGERTDFTDALIGQCLTGGSQFAQLPGRRRNGSSQLRQISFQSDEILPHGIV